MNEYLKCAELSSDSVSNMTYNGNGAIFDLHFLSGNNDGTYQVAGSYDCGTAMIGMYSSLSVSDNTAMGFNNSLIGDGYSLTLSGTVTCNDL